MKSFNAIREKTLTPAELKKREEIAKAMERETPNMPMDKKMAIATATAKKVAETSVTMQSRSADVKPQSYVDSSSGKTKIRMVPTKGRSSRDPNNSDVQEATSSTKLELVEEVDMEKLRQLARYGLVDKANVQKLIQAFKKMQDGKVLQPNQRELMLNVLTDLASIVTGDSQMFQKAKKAVQEGHIGAIQGMIAKERDLEKKRDAGKVKDSGWQKPSADQKAKPENRAKKLARGAMKTFREMKQEIGEARIDEKTGVFGGDYTSKDHMMGMKNFMSIRDKKAKQRDAEHQDQDPKMAKMGYAKHMMDMDKAKSKAAKKGVNPSKTSRSDYENRNGMNPNRKLPEDTRIDEKYDTPVKKKPVSMMSKAEKDKNDERRKAYKEFQKSLRKEEVQIDEAKLSQQQRDRLDDLIFNVMITGNIEYDGKDNPTRHLKTIEKEFGPKVAKQVEAGMDIKNWGRDNHSSGFLDSLAYRKKSRISASGKMNKQDAVALGKRIMQDKSFGGLTKKVKLPEDTQIDEISMTKMGAYAGKAVKSRDDAKSATKSADSNRVVKAGETLRKRKAGADNYNKKMWGYGNVAPTKESMDEAKVGPSHDEIMKAIGHTKNSAQGIAILQKKFKLSPKEARKHMDMFLKDDVQIDEMGAFMSSPLPTPTSMRKEPSMTRPLMLTKRMNTAATLIKKAGNTPVSPTK